MKTPSNIRSVAILALALMLPTAAYLGLRSGSPAENFKRSVPLLSRETSQLEKTKVTLPVVADVHSPKTTPAIASEVNAQALPAKERLIAMLGRPIKLNEDGSTTAYEVSRTELYIPFQDNPKHSLRTLPAALPVRDLVARAEMLGRDKAVNARLVFYPLGAKHDATTRRVLTDDMVLRSVPERLQQALLAVQQTKGLKAEISSESRGTIVVTDTRFPGASLTTLEALKSDASVQSIEPMLTMNLHSYAVPNDTLFAQQWYLKNTRQVTPAVAGIDINVVTTWDTYQGSGINILFMDEGMETNHPDLVNNYNPAYSRDYIGGDLVPDPAIFDAGLGDKNENHGTAVVGLGVGYGNNAQGISGSAPRASWSGLRMIGADMASSDLAHAFRWKLDQNLDIKSASWGPPDDMPNALGTLPTVVRDAMMDGVTLGRQGKGVIMVFAAGNGRAAGMQGNKNGFANAYVVNAISAVNASGALSAYSQFGAHIVACAPSTGSASDPKIVTSDRTGLPGYNASGAGDVSDLAYTQQGFVGTSAAAPIATGVIALMLEAKPDLTWRDVQEILLRSGKQLNPTDADWTTRVGGRRALPTIKHHHQFGGGLIDAQVATTLAKNWELLEPHTSLERSYTSSLAIPDNNTTGSVASYDLNTAPLLRVENVEVEVDISHARRGDLEILLTSPSNVTSQLIANNAADDGAKQWPGNIDIPAANRGYRSWRFSSKRHWGEMAKGVWKLTLKDRATGTTGTLNSATLRLFGSDVQPAKIASAPDSIIAIAGQAASFVMEAAGSYDISFSWRKGTVTIPGATNPTLSLTNIGLADAGTYTVEATNVSGTDSASASLGVIVPPPSTATANVGQPFTLTAQAAGEGLTYQWMRGGVPLTNGGNISGVTTPVLTIDPLGAADGSNLVGTYELVVSLGTTTRTMPGTTVNVRVPPTIVTKPIDRVVAVGVNTNFSATGGGTTEINYQWKKDGAAIAGATTGNLPVPAVKLTDAGVYTIEVFNAAGSNNESANLAVYVPLPANATGNLGKRLELEVQATGNVTYQWRRNGVPLTNGGAISGATSNKLIIEPLAPGDAATYDVIITSGTTSQSAGQTAVAVRVPPVIVTPPANAIVPVGQAGTFTVVAGGTNDISYRWRKGTTAITTSTTPTLTLTNLKLTDAGPYTAEVYNAAGNAAATAQLSVFTTPPATATGNVNKPFVIEVPVAGTGLTFQWLRNGVPFADGGGITGTNTNKLTITPLDPEDEGIYELVITSGSVSRPAGATEILVRTVPTVITPPTSLVVQSGQPASFTVQVGGTTDVSYRWRKGAVEIPGATSPTLNIASTKLADAGTYSVEVYNAAGSNVSSASLAVVVPQPPSTTVNNGSKIVLEVTPAGPGATYQWRRGGVNLIDDGRIVGAQTNKLCIDPARPEDDSNVAGPYECVITLPNGGGTTTGPTTVTIRNAPSVFQGPQNQIVFVGQNAAFNVIASGSNEISYRWKKNGTTITTATTANLALSAVKLTDAGTYTAEVYNAAGSNSATATLIVIQAPPTTIPISSGKKLVIEVPVAGTGATYQWTRGGVNLIDDGRITGATTNKLCISPVTGDDDSAVTGPYICIITLPGGPTKPAGETTVTVALPPTLTTTGITIPDMIVSGPTEIKMPALTGITRWTVSGLPAGLTFDPKTGNISGIPNVAVTDHPVTISACNAVGCTTITIRITIKPLDPRLIGIYDGLIDRNVVPTANSGHGGTIQQFTVTAIGNFSGRITLAERTYPFLGRLIASPTADPVAKITIARPGMGSILMDFSLEPEFARMDGMITESTKWSARLEAYRAAYSTADPAYNVLGWHSLYAEMPGAILTGEAPQGAITGWFDVKLNGTYTMGLRMPETLAIITKTGMIGKGGHMPFHNMAFANRGSLQGWMHLVEKDLPEPDLVEGTLSWRKVGAASSTDTFFNRGFDIGGFNGNTITVVGSEYPRPLPGNILWGLENTPTNTPNAQFRFYSGGIEQAAMINSLNIGIRITTAHTITYPHGNAAGFVWEIHPTNGTFFGSAKIKDGALVRVVRFYGYFVPGTTRGGGFFVVPPVPGALGSTATKTMVGSLDVLPYQ